MRPLFRASRGTPVAIEFCGEALDFAKSLFRLRTRTRESNGRSEHPLASRIPA